MTPEETLTLYRESVERLLKVVETHPDTSGGRAAGQVLLGTYNSYHYHMDLVDLVFLDSQDLRAAVHVIWLRTLTSREPHTLVEHGSNRFLALEGRFRHLHVERRYGRHYQEGAAPAPAAQAKAGPEYFARIRPGSKYAGQDNGKPFPVRLNDCPTDGYLWRGGPGGQYRHSDLNLFVKSAGDLVPLPAFAAGESVQVVEQILGSLQELADKGDLCPEWADPWCQGIQERLSGIVRTAGETWRDEE